MRGRVALGGLDRRRWTPWGIPRDHEIPGRRFICANSGPLGKSDRVVALLDLQTQLQEDKQLPSFSWFYKKNTKIGPHRGFHDGKLAPNLVIG